MLKGTVGYRLGRRLIDDLIAIGLPRVIPDEILLFSLCLLSTTIISKTVAFNFAFQYWTLVFSHRFKKKYLRNGYKNRSEQTCPESPF